MSTNISDMIPLETISQKIFIIRGFKVMLDSDLAELYQVSTKNLNKAVGRNSKRFPKDFVFQLSKEEDESLRFQIGTSKEGKGGRRYLPYAFTEHGVAMLSAVLKSDRAVEMSLFIVHAFIKLREILSSNKELAYKVEELERGQQTHSQYIANMQQILKRLISEPIKPKEPIGFRRET